MARLLMARCGVSAQLGQSFGMPLCMFFDSCMHAPAAQVLDYAKVVYGPDKPGVLQKTYVVRTAPSLCSTCTPLMAMVGGVHHAQGNSHVCWMTSIARCD